MTQRVIDKVLRAYSAAVQPQCVTDLGAAGGFSGAHFWRVTTDHGDLCLRKWPPGHPDALHLQYIHEVLHTARASGLNVVPVPFSTVDGQTFLAESDHLWELTPWMPGRADYWRLPTRQRLANALTCLAEFHAATREMETDLAPSPGIAQRTQFLQKLVSQSARELRTAASASSLGWHNLQIRADRLLRLFDAAAEPTQKALESCRQLVVRHQPCIRDIWHDHLLFEGEEVRGIVDFGAMRHDHVATDISRLLGSLVNDDPIGWDTGLAAYQSVQSLTAEELRLIRVFDMSSVVLSGMNWLCWIYLEGRRFENRTAIEKRLDGIIQRFEHLVGKDGYSRPNRTAY